MLSVTRFVLLCQQLFFAWVLAGTTKSDMASGNISATRYKVTPTDQHNATAIAATEFLLREQYRDADVQTIPDTHSLPTWLITSNQDNTGTTLRQVGGVSTVTTDTAATITKREGGRGPRQSELVKPPALPATKYSVLATDGSDLKKTEAFLRTQIEHGTDFFEAGLEGYGRCWGNVTLTDAAKAVLEKYEGIAGIEPEGELIALMALPNTGTKQGHPLLESKLELVNRATTQWQT